MINIEGLNKAKVLVALYDASHVQGMGFLQAVDYFTVSDAEGLIDEMQKDGRRLYFDYLYGRVLKVDITKDEFNENLFDRDCGEGAALIAIEYLKSKYKKIDAATGADLEEAISYLKEQKALTVMNFNDHPIYSDNLDENEVFKRVTGKTKEEFLRSKWLEKAKQHKEEFEKNKPKLKDEYISKARGIIDEDKLEEWDKIVPIRLDDLYEGMELQATLDVIQVLKDKGKEEAKKTLYSQGHSGMSYWLMKAMLKTFAPNGEELVSYLEDNDK